MGGGKPKETVLWTNPSPTSNFTATTITVSIIGNYDLLKFTYRYSATDERENSALIFVSDFIANVLSGNNFRVALGAYNSANRTRYVIWNPDTSKIEFSNAVNATGGTTNAACIPTSITGIKY